MKSYSRSLVIKGLLVLFAVPMAWGAEMPFAKWADHTLVLDNKVVSRKVVFQESSHSFRTIELKLQNDAHNYVGAANDEFSFELNGTSCRGDSGWEIKGFEPMRDSRGGDGAALVLKSVKPNLANLELKIVYLLYPQSPVIRKQLVLKNTSDSEVKVESLDVERLRPTMSVFDLVYTNYARRARVGPYVGDCYDSLIVLHDDLQSKGLVLGNEAPGVLKRTTTFLDGATVSIGLTHKEQTYPFRKWLKPGESWESTWSFICPYRKCGRPEAALDGPVADYVRRHMGLRLAELPTKPQFVYNTWSPFGENVSESLMLELAEAAAACGAKEFIIDAGWYCNEFSPPNDNWAGACGDYLTDKRKFPRGLKPVFDRVRALGMRPGLWLSIASVGKSSRVYRDHPEWLVRDRHGNPSNLHTYHDPIATACMTTEWYDYIKSVMLRYVKENDLKYIKIDLSIATSAYRFDDENTGCFATNHPHKDRAESLLMIYQRAWQLFDELHAAAPELYIDCTFETMGKCQLIDLDMCKHAHGNWISNFGGSPPQSTLQARNLAWWASSTVPASSLMIGGPSIDSENSDLVLSSIAGSIPVFWGDPRRLSPSQKARLHAWSDWLVQMQEKHNYSMYRQNLPGFDQPRNVAWDGWQRINTDSRDGGMVGVFRQGSKESQRTIAVEGLDPHRVYTIRRGPQGEVIKSLTGKELQEKGFPVSFDNSYDGAVFEIDQN